MVHRFSKMIRRRPADIFALKPCSGDGKLGNPAAKEPFHVYTELVALRDSLGGSISTVTKETLSASG
jgi:hypothetical protein